VTNFFVSKPFPWKRTIHNNTHKRRVFYFGLFVSKIHLLTREPRVQLDQTPHLLTALLFCKPTCRFVLACVFCCRDQLKYTHTHTHTHTHTLYSSHQNRLVRILKNNTSQRHHNDTYTKRRELYRERQPNSTAIPKQSQSFEICLNTSNPGQLRMTKSNCKEKNDERDLS
jgi:hypothetical protein